MGRFYIDHCCLAKRWPLWSWVGYNGRQFAAALAGGAYHVWDMVQYVVQQTTVCGVMGEHGGQVVRAVDDEQCALVVGHCVVAAAGYMGAQDMSGRNSGGCRAADPYTLRLRHATQPIPIESASVVI